MPITPDVHELNFNFGTGVAPPPNTSTPRVSVVPVDDTISEGGIARFNIRRHDVETTPCSVRWRASSNVDVIIGLTSAVSNFPGGATSVVVPIEVQDFVGAQGDRFLTMGLESPTGCVIDPTLGSAQVRVTDKAVTGFANGFENRVRVRLSQYGPGSAVGAMFWFNETLPIFKAVANGGEIASAVAVVGPPARVIPYDLRFELGGDINGQGGTKVPHRVRTYGQGSGRLLCAVRLPNPDLNIENDVWCYFGRAGLTASEEDLAGVSVDYLSWFSFPEGIDVAKGRNLTVTGVTSTTLQGGVAGGRWVNAGENASLADASYLTGLTDMSFWAFVDADGAVLGQARGIMMQGNPGAGGGTMGFALGKLATGAAGVVDPVYAKVRCSDGEHNVVGPTNSMSVVPSVIAASRTPNQPMPLVVDGVVLTPSATANKAGAISLISGAPVGVGVGPHNTSRWSGVIVESGVLNRYVSPHVWQLFQKSLLKLKLAYGLGAPETLGSTPSVVAMPVTVAIDNANRIDVDVMSYASIPAGQTGTVTTLTSPVGGTFSLVGRNIRYQPSTGFVGDASVLFTIDAAGNLSQSQLNVVVSQAVPAKTDIEWGGINSPTGQQHTANSLTLTTSACGELSLELVRMGMDDVGGKSVGQAFDFTVRDQMVNGLIAAGIAIHCIIEPFTTVHINPINEANWRNFVNTVLNRYRTKIFAYSIGNEPEDIASTTTLVNYTKWAVEERDSLGLKGVVSIFSPPFKGAHHNPGGTFDLLVQALAALPVVSRPDGIDCHSYNNQVEDYLGDTPIKENWELMQAAGLTNMPQIYTECGNPLNGTVVWNPSGFPGGQAGSRANWIVQAATQYHAYGISRAIFFDLAIQATAGGGDWRVVVPTAPDSATYTKRTVECNALATSNWGTPSEFSNGDFATAENGSDNWVVRQPIMSNVILTGTQVFFDTTGGRTSPTCLRMALSATPAQLVVRQVCKKLEVGVVYRVSAYAFTTGGTATLTVRGYNRTDGLANVSAQTTVRNAWTELVVTTPPITTSWIVIELRGDGTTGLIRWDDVTLVRPVLTPLMTVPGRLVTHAPDTSSSGYRALHDVPFSDELWLDYYITWGPTLDWDTPRDSSSVLNNCPPGVRQSGKFPGLSARGDIMKMTAWNGTGNTDTKFPEGWSTRCGFDPFGEAHTYLYDQERANGSGGRKFPWRLPWSNGTGPQFFFVKGTKYRITQRVRINDPGVANGHLEQWLDGARCYLKTNVIWRGVLPTTWIFKTADIFDPATKTGWFRNDTGLANNQTYDPGPGGTVANIGSYKLHNYYGGGDCDSPTYQSFVTLGKSYIWTSAPDFLTPLDP